MPNLKNSNTSTTVVEADELKVQEKQFRKRVDMVIKYLEIAMTAAVTIGSIACPPIAYLAAIALLIIAAINYYDKKHNYEISHWFENKFNKLNDKFSNHKDELQETVKQNIQHIEKNLSEVKQQVSIKNLNKLAKKVSAELPKIENIKVKIDLPKLSAFNGALFAKPVKKLVVTRKDLDAALNKVKKEFKLG